MRVADLETPALVIDLDIMERNLSRVSGYARQHRLRLRPHIKTHKIPALARRQIALGADGLTVAKVGEAEVMLGAEPADVLVAYPVIGASKLQRLMEVARRARVTVALDSLTAARQLSEAAVAAGVNVGVLAEADVGLGRVGVTPGAELVEFAKAISRFSNLSLLGVAFYPGHIKTMDEKGHAELARLSEILQGIESDFRQAGLPLEIVSGGSTPTLFESHCVKGMNEIRPGTYIFNDRNTVECGACSWDDCAASILVTVVSTARPAQIILDGGSKTFSSDRLATTGEATFGVIREAPGAVFHKLMEEHGFVDIRGVDPARFQVGDRVRVIPNHICVCMNLHEQVYGIRGDVVEERWNVAARGKLQ